MSWHLIKITWRKKEDFKEDGEKEEAFSCTNIELLYFPPGANPEKNNIQILGIFINGISHNGQRILWSSENSINMAPMYLVMNMKNM